MSMRYCEKQGPLADSKQHEGQSPVTAEGKGGRRACMGEVRGVAGVPMFKGLNV